MRGRSSVEDRVTGIFDRLFAGTAFALQLPDRPPRQFGHGEPAFQFVVRNQAGLAALGSLNEKRIGAAYLAGEIDLNGDVVAALDLRTNLRDQRRLAYLFTTYGLGYLWATYAQPRLFGQIKCDSQWISQHYDLESDFYLLFLDKQAHCYSHGYFSSDDDSLESAIQRKLDTAIAACGMRPGWRVLDIGAGWGAFTEHAGRQGIQVTSLTISAESERYVRELIEREQLPCRVLLEHFLEHATDEPYDAIVNFGVTEHLPDYRATLAQYRRLLNQAAECSWMRAPPAGSTRSARSFGPTSGRVTPRRCTSPPTSRKWEGRRSRCCMCTTTVITTYSRPCTGRRT